MIVCCVRIAANELKLIEFAGLPIENCQLPVALLLGAFSGYWMDWLLSDLMRRFINESHRNDFHSLGSGRLLWYFFRYQWSVWPSKLTANLVSTLEIQFVSNVAYFYYYLSAKRSLCLCVNWINHIIVNYSSKLLDLMWYIEWLNSFKSLVQNVEISDKIVESHSNQLQIKPRSYDRIRSDCVSNVTHYHKK